MSAIERRVHLISSNAEKKTHQGIKTETGQQREACTQEEMLIEGRNAVMEALRAETPIDKLYLAKGNTGPASSRLISVAKSRNIPIVECDRRKLDAISITHIHQGVVAVTAVREYASVDDIFLLAKNKGEQPLIVVCDGLSDPHNLGAIIRTAECTGAHGVVIPKHRSVGLTATVERSSAGAVNHIPVARVGNLTTLLRKLKEQGLWIFGTTADGDTPLYQTDLTEPTAIVVGNEGNGMSRLVTETCDFRIAIPLRGKVNSLNVSVAAAVVLYEALRQRMGS